MTSKHLFFLLITLSVTNAFGQVPVITHVDKYINGNGQTVTISGSNFGTNAADIVVWFGGVQGTIATISDQTIEATVPPGTTYESIVVTNTTTNRLASSEGQFMLSYGGDSPLSLARISPQADLDAETGLFDVCMCDLDNDGLNDIAGANSGSSVSAPANGVSIFKNTSTIGGALTFAAKVPVSDAPLSSIRTVNIKCADLNGDGLKELILSEADPGNHIYILKNNGSLSFTPQNIQVPGKTPKRIDVADLDGDGLPELVVTDQNSANEDFMVFPNTSTGGTISFATHKPFSIPSFGSDGLAVQDLNGDNRPDIVVSQVLSSTGNVYVFRNQSTPGNFVFNDVIKADIAPATPNSTGGPVNVRVGDIDGDQKADIVATQFLGSRIAVLRNQSTGSEIQFSAPTSVATDLYPYGLDLGDLDGNGKLDIVVASLTGPDGTPKSLTILNNTSTTGNVSFTRLTQSTTYINRHVAIGDLNGDSKPDIAYASVDDEGNGIPASKISFFRNQNCIVPKITPGGTIQFCPSFLPFTLEATDAGGAAYTWKDGGTANGVTTRTFTSSSSGTYTVDILSDGCTRTSNVVTVTIGTGNASPPTITNNSPLCEGGTINLGIQTPVVGETYNWTGPASYVANNTINPSRPSYKPEFAGRYEVQVFNNGCLAAKASTLVETISLPSFSVTMTGSDVICTGDTKLLTAFPNDANFSYQWSNASGDIGGATTPTLNVNSTGSYKFTATSILYPGCPEVEADAVDILLAAPPVANFDAPAETCKDVVTTFTNTSITVEAAGPEYAWDFGDTGTSADKSPAHTYHATATVPVKLTVTYRDGACPIAKQKNIKISLPPTAAITAPGNVFEFCEGEHLTLGVDAAFDSYKWSNDDTTPTTDITEGATYSVQLKNSIGCTITVNQVVTMLPAPHISITAEKNPINLGEQTKLSASAGFDAYEWTPAETLDDATSQTPVAKPGFTTTYTVQVVGSNGCLGSDSLRVEVILDNPTNLLKIANFFSPNDDTSNPVWKVEPREIVQMCGVTIFDEKGVKVYEAKPYNNDWDGSSNGKKLPSGVYYYIVRCDGDSGSKTGSITILR